MGRKDITAHVNFTAMALAAQEAGLNVLGYTTQAHFLINCGLLPKMEHLPQAQRATAAKLIMEHEMGELFNENLTQLMVEDLEEELLESIAALVAEQE